MTEMNMPDRWQSIEFLTEYLAKQLITGRLGLFLGAGVSQPFGLPGWEELVERVAAKVGATCPARPFDPITVAGEIKASHFTSEADYNQAVKECLYRGSALDFSKIASSQLLSAVGSLVMSSQRGSAAKVFTLNFDDFLELYLEFHGFTTSFIHEEQHWASNTDVTVYHPHGFLPLGHDGDSEKIVLGSKEFHKIILSEYWRPVIQTALRQHTFLYLGLSGEDIHLQNHWTELEDKHARHSDERAAYYSGVRFVFAGKEDNIMAQAESYRIYTQELSDYDALPNFLFGICQKARELRSSAI